MSTRTARWWRRFWRASIATALAALAVPERPALASGWGEGYLPNAIVTDQDGRALRFYDDVIRDKIVVVSFIYTGCSSICPLMTARLAELQRRLADVAGRDIFFVSISIDPLADTPERLKEYAESFSAGPGWVFLTAAPDTIDEIRYKLGERSRLKGLHANDILLGNARTGEWARDSIMSDLGTLAITVRGMDPVWRSQPLIDAGVSNSGTGVAQAPLDTRPGEALFRRACAACHAVGGGARVGPDLAGLTTRRQRDWIVRYIADPAALRRRNDPAALELLARFPRVRMPNLGLGADDAADVLRYLETRAAAVAKAASPAP